MAIEKRNLYSPGQNLNNQAVNIDDNRLSADKSSITVSFAVSPATVTVEVGSFIEVNGSGYTVVTADEVFQLSSAAHNYITFNGTVFASAATKGTWDAEKQGFYSGTARTLEWYIDDTNNLYYINESITELDKDILEENNRVTQGKIDVGGLANIQGVTESDGGLEVGNSGTVLDEIIKITGTTDGDSLTQVSYPSGFTKANTYILSMKVFNSTNTAWDFAGAFLSTYTDSLYAYIDDSQIVLIHTQGRNQNQTYHLLLVRI